MSKKLLSLLLMLGLMVFAVGAATAQDATEEPAEAAEGEMMETAAVECPEGEATVTAALGAVGVEFEVGQAQAERYMEQCPNITVELIEMPNEATDRLGQYQQYWEAQSGDVDIYQVDVIWPGIIEPHVVDMNEYLGEEYISQFFPAMIEGQTIDGKLVAIPWFTDAAGLYYRTDLLEKYGLEVPATWDELTTAAQTIQDGEREETGNEEFYGFVWQGNAYEGLTCDAHEWITSESGQTFIAPDGTVNADNEAVINALDRAAGWVGAISPEGVTGFGEEESRAVFQAGNAAFLRNWPYVWGTAGGEDSAIAGLYEYVPLPAGESGNSVACLGGWQLAVSQYSDNVDAAVSVAQFLASSEEQKIRAISPQGANPTIPALYEDPEIIEANPLFERMGPILATAVARPSAATLDRYNEASQLFYTAVHSVLTGEETAEDAMINLQIDLEDLMAEIQGE